MKHCILCLDLLVPRIVAMLKKMITLKGKPLQAMIKEVNEETSHKVRSMGGKKLIQSKC